MDNKDRLKVFADILANDNHIDSHSQRRSVMVKHIMPLMLVSLFATCQPSYAETLIAEKSSFIKKPIASHYQSKIIHSLNYIDVVAASGNNKLQELQNLLKTVQHHTIVDVFLCLSFIFLPFTGELRLALAYIALWWGGHKNKPLGANTVCRLFLAVLNLPATLTLGQIIKTLLPVRKV